MKRCRQRSRLGRSRPQSLARGAPNGRGIGKSDGPGHASQIPALQQVRGDQLRGDRAVRHRVSQCSSRLELTCGFGTRGIRVHRYIQCDTIVGSAIDCTERRRRMTRTVKACEARNRGPRVHLSTTQSLRAQAQRADRYGGSEHELETALKCHRWLGMTALTIIIHAAGLPGRFTRCSETSDGQRRYWPCLNGLTGDGSLRQTWYSFRVFAIKLPDF
jgi:hypothetical protein